MSSSNYVSSNYVNYFEAESESDEELSVAASISLGLGGWSLPQSEYKIVENYIPIEPVFAEDADEDLMPALEDEIVATF